jgi:hypothetical protein
MVKLDMGAKKPWGTRGGGTEIPGRKVVISCSESLKNVLNVNSSS